MDPRPRVLHITNRFSAGVKTAITQYAQALPDCDHFLMSNSEPWDADGPIESVFIDRFPFHSRAYGAVRQINALARYLAVDVLHAHSSVAGALVRLTRTPASIVYTPHAYAALAPRGSREWLAGQMEWVFGMRRIVIAAPSEDEIVRSNKYSRGGRIVRIINRPDAALRQIAKFRTPLTVVMTGRISTQKDPKFFAQVAEVCRGEMRFRWLGDGDVKGRYLLKQAGVDVTGWLSRADLHSEQAAAGMYLHTAIYEGSCLSILDAAALGVPSIGRPVPGVREIKWMTHASSPMKAAAILRAHLDEEVWQAAAARASAGAQALTIELQARLLRDAYGFQGHSDQNALCLGDGGPSRGSGFP